MIKNAYATTTINNYSCNEMANSIKIIPYPYSTHPQPNDINIKLQVSIGNNYKL